MKNNRIADKSVFRKILMVFGVLQILFFFVLPYASLNDLMGGMNDLAGSLGSMAGVETFPNSITGLSAVKLFTGANASALGGDEMSLYAVLYVIPAAGGLLIALMHLLGKGRLSYVGTILLSFVMLAALGLITVVQEVLAQAGYETGFGGILLILLTAVQLIIAIAGCVKDKREKKKAVSGTTVKPGKHDGTLIGIQGTYEGAVIPLKDGKPVFIGRDPKACSVVIKGENVSRKHCSVTYNAGTGTYSVTDFSVNGVFDKNGRRLESGKISMLTSGNEIHIGATEEIFRLG